MMKNGLVLLTLVLLALSGVANTSEVAGSRACSLSLPVGWRLPHDIEVDQAWRLNNPTRYLSVEGNFAGGTTKETAMLLVRADGSAFAPFVAIEHKGGAMELVQVEAENPVSELEVEGLKLAPAGTYVSACGKGYGCGPREKKTVTLTFEGIEFFKNEGPRRLIYFDPTRKALTETWLSD